PFLGPQHGNLAIVPQKINVQPPLTAYLAIRQVAVFDEGADAPDGLGRRRWIGTDKFARRWLVERPATEWLL
ncbi:hypothetical protein, partial [Pseudomonas indica]|uniref:hypothetical protein n=1 Tax=Pseudomonas indica TaxID=137658 RepID=UPI0023F698A8